MDKDFALSPFAVWTPPQRKLYRVVRNLWRSKRPVRIIIVKPRQTGISTLVEGLAYNHAGHNDNRRVLITAQEEDPALINIYSMFQRFHSSQPDALQPKLQRDSMEMMTFGNGSRISHKTAALGATRKKESGKGRGATYSFFHGSEVAYWTVPDRFFSGSEDGIPDRHGTFVFLESTANGVGNWFHRRWVRAAKGWRMVQSQSGTPRWTMVDKYPTSWVPFFISWLEQPEYYRHLTETDRDYYDKHLDKDERRLVDEFGASLEQIEWRRYQIDKKDGDTQMFMQEYPVEPSEAFIFSGRKVFDMGALRWYMDESRQREADSPAKRGRLVVT